MSYTNLAIGGAVFAGLMQLTVSAALPTRALPRALVVEHFSYSDGHFTQQVSPTGGDGISADWSAEINRVADGYTRQLCIGRGDGVYKGTRDRYITDDWVGDDCPDLLPGDVAEAVWTWQDENGQIRSVSASLVIE